MPFLRPAGTGQDDRRRICYRTRDGIGHPFRTSGLAVVTPATLAAILRPNRQKRDVSPIDEIHRLPAR